MGFGVGRGFEEAYGNDSRNGMGMGGGLEHGGDSDAGVVGLCGSCA